jgi:hypothetical protein
VVLATMTLANPDVTSAAPRAMCGPAWHQVPVPAPPGEGVLRAVKAISSSDVWAAGEAPGLFAEHLDGSKWTLVPLLKPGKGPRIAAIDAGGPDDVWVVGNYLDGYWYRFAEHWDGVAWTLMPMPNIPRKYFNFVNGLVVLGSDDAWAVGHHYRPGYADYVVDVLHWDGTSWTEVPNPAPGGTQMFDVDATGPDDIWALGLQDRRPFVMRSDGSSWRVPAAQPVRSPLLTDLEAISPADVWAVGEAQLPRRGAVPAAEHWDGGSWTWTPVPDIPSQDPIWGISAVRSDDVWAVGFHGLRSIHAETSLWDGANWRHEPIPDLPKPNELYDVSALPSGRVWAVGFVPSAGGDIRPLVLARCDP